MDEIITYFLWFILYSFFGWLYETVICSISQRHFVNRGFLNGPYCPIYGTGALLMILALGRLTNPLALFFLGAILACVLEYITSYGMEKLFHARWWDYSKRRFNIHGRVCLLGGVIFGLFAVLLIRLVHPPISAWVASIPPLYRRIAAGVLFAGFVTDAVFSIRGMVGLQKKLEEHAAALERRRALALEKFRDSPAYATVKSHREALYQRLSAQQRRIIDAFPRLRLHRHNELLEELRQAIAQQRARRKGH